MKTGTHTQVPVPMTNPMTNPRCGDGVIPTFD